MHPVKKLLCLLLFAFVLVPFVSAGFYDRVPSAIPWQLRNLWRFSALFSRPIEAWLSTHVFVEDREGRWVEIPLGPPFNHDIWGGMTRFDLMLNYLVRSGVEQDPEARGQRERILQRIARVYLDLYQDPDNDLTSRDGEPIARPIRGVRFIRHPRPVVLDGVPPMWSRHFIGDADEMAASTFFEMPSSR